MPFGAVGGAAVAPEDFSEAAALFDTPVAAELVDCRDFLQRLVVHADAGQRLSCKNAAADAVRAEQQDAEAADFDHRRRRAQEVSENANLFIVREEEPWEQQQADEQPLPAGKPDIRGADEERDGREKSEYKAFVSKRGEEAILLI